MACQTVGGVTVGGASHSSSLDSSDQRGRLRSEPSGHADHAPARRHYSIDRGETDGVRRRPAIAPLVNAGRATCARCGEPIHAGEEWHLGHNNTRDGYLGVSHSACNLQAPPQSPTAVDHYRTSRSAPTSGHNAGTTTRRSARTPSTAAVTPRSTSATAAGNRWLKGRTTRAESGTRPAFCSLGEREGDVPRGLARWA